jgi:hypothetical protein
MRLPGKNKTIVALSSKSIDDIFETINNVPNSDTYILENGDVWRYVEYESDIVNHPKLDGRYVFLHHIGYNNVKISDTKFKISFPILFFTRTVEPLVIKPDNLLYGYSCLNNNNQTHRLELGFSLYKSGLLKDVIFTQNNEYPNNNIRNELIEYVTTLPIRWVDSDSDFWTNKLDYSTNHTAYHHAYCNIVTESEIDYPLVSEKSFKPFISGQIPVMVAASGHVEYLRGLGFELMEDFLPSGYDTMSIEEKIKSIVELVGRGTEYARDFYYSNLDKIKYNHALISSDTVDKLIIKRITDLL